MSSSASPISPGNSMIGIYRRHPVLVKLLSSTSSDTSAGNMNSDSEKEHTNIVETPKRPKTQKKLTKKKEAQGITARKLADTKEKIIKIPKATETKAAGAKKVTVEKSEASKNVVTKKITTKDMIDQALIELNTRKGVSLYAIKKFIAEKYNVDTEKVSHIIKRQLKIGVEEGRIKQTRGVGASGSFKRVATKEIRAKDKTKESDEPLGKKSKANEAEKPKIKTKTDAEAKTKKDTGKISAKENKKDLANVSNDMPKKSEQPTKKSAQKSDKVTKNSKQNDADKKKTVKMKTAKGDIKTPSAKKMQTIRRKSIVKIKPPKMKPKALD